jgi:lipid-A-disaccharide synthase-like uncharacterized protein
MTSWLSTANIWLVIGFAGQALFASRFFIQWFRSEMVGRSIVPVSFWYFSIAGGLVTLVYAVHVGKDALPFLMGQAGGLVVYARNLFLIFRERKAMQNA